MQHRRAIVAGAMVSLLSAPFAVASAQVGGRTLAGLVVDSAGVPIARADVGIVLLRRLTRTDDSGRFVFAGIPGDSVEFSVRHIGHKAAKVRVRSDDTIRIVLARSAAVLEAVDVRTRRLREGIEGFYRRSISGMGAYVTREDIEHQNTMRTSDALRSTAGIRFVRVAGGLGIRFNSASIVRRDCTPMIWLDGQRAPGLEIDNVPAPHVEGIELYSGPSTTPLQFSQYSSSSTCGTIVVWTRQPGL